MDERRKSFRQLLFTAAQGLLQGFWQRKAAVAAVGTERRRVEGSRQSFAKTF